MSDRSGRDAAPQVILASATIFLAAFFLFQVESIVTKQILPWFGGSASVWTTCLLFFQVALLAGYWYAHALTVRLSPQWQMRVHISLVLLSLAWLPLLPSARWQQGNSDYPTLTILGLLTVVVGLPFVLLASTGPLVQAWLARSRSVGTGVTYSPYRLYALSNLASMIALLSYPILVEPLVALHTQGWLWSAGYALFAAISIVLARKCYSIESAPSARPKPSRPARSAVLMWFLLAAVPSALLLATTNHMLRNIAAIPLLWVAPLALYLLSFIVCFDRPKWYRRSIWYPLFVVGTAWMIYTLGGDFPIDSARLLICFYAAGLFICCMVCHGELSALKPEPEQLTAYYLTISGGGAVGGMLVAVAAPAIFTGNYDFPLALVVAALLVAYVAWKRFIGAGVHWRRLFAFAASLLLFAVCSTHMVLALMRDASGNLLMVRNFYGTLSVRDRGNPSDPEQTRELKNGTILHGAEFTTPSKHKNPLTYYTPRSGVGKAIRELELDGPLKIGAIGLGAGTVTGFGRPGDTYRFYELNPAVETIARTYFWYLSGSPAMSSVILGDGRLSLEREAPEMFDVLIVDAFSSDAIPVHLLTKEAMALYWRHLKPNGVLAVHVSNKYLDLAPIVALAAKVSGKEARMVTNYEDDPRQPRQIQLQVAQSGRTLDAPDQDFTGMEVSDWVLVTSRPGFFDRPELKNAYQIEVPAGLKPWTDDYSNLWMSLE